MPSTGSSELIICPACHQQFIQIWKNQVVCSTRCAAAMNAQRAVQRRRAWLSECARTLGASACWIWPGATNGAGYCQVMTGGVRIMAHRFAYEQLVGPIPLGKELDHLCRNRQCVNPAHLEVVTSRENALRSPTSPSAINARKTHCCRGHELNFQNTILEFRGGTVVGRHCRICKQMRAKTRSI